MEVFDAAYKSLGKVLKNPDEVVLRTLGKALTQEVYICSDNLRGGSNPRRVHLNTVCKTVTRTSGSEDLTGVLRLKTPPVDSGPGTKTVEMGPKTGSERSDFGLHFRNPGP